MKDWYCVAIAGTLSVLRDPFVKESVSVLFDGLEVRDATTLLSQGSILRQIFKYVRLSQ